MAEVIVSEDELTALALAADPDTPLPDDAVSLWDVAGTGPVARLPEWYLPAPVWGGRVRGWRRALILLFVLTFVVIDAYGLCNTYGWVAFG